MNENSLASPLRHEGSHLSIYQPFIEQLSVDGQSLPGEYPFIAVYQVLQGALEANKYRRALLLQYPNLEKLHATFTHLQGDAEQIGIFRAQLIEELRKMSYELQERPLEERTLDAFRGLPFVAPFPSKQEPTRRYVVKTIFGDRSVAK